jgi:hypothetical protein
MGGFEIQLAILLYINKLNAFNISLDSRGFVSL